MLRLIVDEHHSFDIRINRIFEANINWTPSPGSMVEGEGVIYKLVHRKLNEHGHGLIADGSFVYEDSRLQDVVVHHRHNDPYGWEFIMGSKHQYLAVSVPLNHFGPVQKNNFNVFRTKLGYGYGNTFRLQLWEVVGERKSFEIAVQEAMV